MNRPPGAAVQPAHSSHLLEGGLFYPTGYVVAGLPDGEQAESLCELFRSCGYSEDECMVVPAERMARACSEDVTGHHFIAALGASAGVRQRQLQLAREGCHFLMVDAPSEAEKQRVLRVLSRVPVRYAVHYHRFVIEDLIEHLSSATPDSAHARSV
ncbi:MAG TPA: hypothetical protein VFA75_20790 [Nevskia sp.]|jgi:hypothetical protein|nr:hypothetical protein [Nevskia sp.]